MKLLRPQTPFISVIVPAFCPKDFNSLIVSMSRNAGDDVEWIVVDDGSGKNYDRVFDSMRRDSVRVIRRTINRRQAAARNIGLSIARGSWIKFLDADDELDEGHLKSLRENTTRERALPFAPTRHVFANGSILDNNSWEDLENEPGKQLARLIHLPFLHHCGVLFPRELLLRLGGYDEELITDEDGDLLIRVLQSGFHFEPVPTARYLYKHHNSSARVSSDDGEAKLMARLRVCSKFEEYYSAMGINMGDDLKLGLARRLDKIALSYWSSNRSSAKRVLERANEVFPGYEPEGGAIKRYVRSLVGISALLKITKLYRSILRRPAGGMQG